MTLPARWHVLAVVVAASLVGLLAVASPAHGSDGPKVSPSRQLVTDVALSELQPAALRTPLENAAERAGPHSSKRTAFGLLAVLAAALGLVPLRLGRRPLGTRRCSASPWRRQFVALRAPPALRFT